VWSLFSSHPFYQNCFISHYFFHSTNTSFNFLGFYFFRGGAPRLVNKGLLLPDVVVTNGTGELSMQLSPMTEVKRLLGSYLDRMCALLSTVSASDSSRLLLRLKSTILALAAALPAGWPSTGVLLLTRSISVLLSFTGTTLCVLSSPKCLIFVVANVCFCAICRSGALCDATGELPTRGGGAITNAPELWGKVGDHFEGIPLIAQIN
jgi:hypothetical protein